MMSSLRVPSSLLLLALMACLGGVCCTRGGPMWPAEATNTKQHDPAATHTDPVLSSVHAPAPPEASKTPPSDSTVEAPAGSTTRKLLKRPGGDKSRERPIRERPPTGHQSGSHESSNHQSSRSRDSASRDSSGKDSHTRESSSRDNSARDSSTRDSTSSSDASKDPKRGEVITRAMVGNKDDTAADKTSTQVSRQAAVREDASATGGGVHDVTEKATTRPLAPSTPASARPADCDSDPPPAGMLC